MRTILFDFDGTIADTLMETMNIFNELSSGFGYKKINLKDKDIWRKKSSREVVKDLGISPIKLPFILRKVYSKLRSRIDYIKPARNLKPVLSMLSRDYDLAILSSNSEENISYFLRKNKIAFFKHIFSGSTVFGKTRLIRRILRKLNLEKEDLIYVGDETRDIESAKEAGVRVIGVSWGFNSEAALRRAGPDFLVDSPKELLKILTKH